MKKTIKDVDVSEKCVFVRVDFNVPLSNGMIIDDTRIRAALPTIHYLVNHRARLILCSHLGRPNGKAVEELRLNPVADRLSVLLGMKVKKVNDCIGPEVESAVKDLKPGAVLLLENIRFHREEKENDLNFAAQLAKLANLYVNDAFGTVHRAHASIEGITHYLPSYIGFLIEQELNTLDRILKNPEHPFIAIFGGIKTTDKIHVIERLEQIDILLAGGGMGYTLLKAQGVKIGLSLVKEESLQVARRIIDKAGDKLILPVDFIVADALVGEAHHKTVSVHEVPAGWHIMDIGPQTINLFQEKLKQARMVIWNGPLGAFEKQPFAEGTFSIAHTVAKLDAVTVIGGGDLATAVNQAGVADNMTHISTGGGAFLNYLAGKELPGIAAIEEKSMARC